MVCAKIKDCEDKDFVRKVIVNSGITAGPMYLSVKRASRTCKCFWKPALGHGKLVLPLAYFSLAIGTCTRNEKQWCMLVCSTLVSIRGKLYPYVTVILPGPIPMNGFNPQL